MATRQYNLAHAGTHRDVAQAVGSAISGNAVRVTIDLAVIDSKSAALKHLEQVKNHILENPWPPA